MYRTARTGVNAGGFHLKTLDSDIGTFSDVDSTHRTIESLPQNTNFVIEQDDITTENLIRSVQISRLIGEGSFGKVYAARSPNNLFGVPFVIKFPTALLNAHGIIMREGCIQINHNVHIQEETMLNVIDNFLSEVSNIEKVLTPIKQSELYRRRFENGRLVRTPGYIYKEIMREAQTYKRHSGHKHIHQFIHYNPDLFCIISELCHGNAYELMKSGNLDKLQDKRSFFIQMALVVHYLLFVIKVAHTDFKPENIFYTNNGHDTYTFKLSDFGYLDDIESLQKNPTHDNNKFMHTPAYCPRSVSYRDTAAQRKFDTPKIMLYSFFASILQALDLQKFQSIDMANAFGGEVRQYSPSFHWINQLDDICTRPMHDLLFEFLNQCYDLSFWIYLGVQSEDWKREFHEIMTDIVSSHNTQPGSSQYTIHN
jgi:serine/threonine protein kinase